MYQFEIKLKIIFFALILLGCNVWAATPSLNGSYITHSGQILVDSASNSWQIGANGTLLKNSVKDLTSLNVDLLVSYNQHLYQKNTANNWWEYNTTGGWTALGANDPRVISPNGVVSPSAADIVDSHHRVWVLNASTGYVYKDGQDSAARHVTELLDYYGVPYTKAVNAGVTTWWAYNGSNWVYQSSGDPTKLVSKSIKSYAKCDGVTDDSVAAATAFAAAKNSAFNLIVDCPVKIHVGADIARTIFIDNNTTVIHYGAGKFIVDNIMLPAFAIANSTNVNLINWNLEYNAQLPISNNYGGYYDNGVFVTNAWTSYQPSQAFQTYRLTPWLEANRAIKYSGATPAYFGANTFATFFISGDTSNLNISGLYAYTPATSTYPGTGLAQANAAASHFIPMLFTFIINQKSNQTVTSTTPITSATYALPHNLVFSDFVLDGTMMGLAGEVQNATFENFVSNRYSDLQDSSGGNIGGIASGTPLNPWFPPPHLFYLRDNPSQGTALRNSGIKISNIVDNGIRLGAARVVGGGQALSLKIGAINSSVTNYLSNRPDGMLQLISSDGLAISNVSGTYDSSFVYNVTTYAGISITAPMIYGTTTYPYNNVSFTNVSLTDLAANTLILPFAQLSATSSTGFKLSNVNMTMKKWGATGTPADRVWGGTGHNIAVNYMVNGVTTPYLQSAQQNTVWNHIEASAVSITAGSSTTLTWKSGNSVAGAAISCTASGAWSGSLPSSGSKVVAVTAKGISNFTITCVAGTAGSAASSVAVTAK